MKAALKKARRFLEWLDADDDPSVPAYDPVHVAAALVITMSVIGALYWLLWTLLVYEGGLFAKLGPGFCVLFTKKTLADYGWRGAPYAMGVFEGWTGNVGALIVCLIVYVALYRAYWDAARKHRK